MDDEMCVCVIEFLCMRVFVLLSVYAPTHIYISSFTYSDRSDHRQSLWGFYCEIEKMSLTAVGLQVMEEDHFAGLNVLLIAVVAVGALTTTGLLISSLVAATH